MTDTLTLVRDAAEKRILYTLHAIQQMAHADRLVTKAEVEAVVKEGDLIEDYPEDPRGHSCLLGGRPGRPIHVVCAPKSEYLAIITAYVPDPSQWTDDFRGRR
jgi:hypothetical protein